MKKITLLALCSFGLFCAASAQNLILNGSFENNSASGPNVYNLTSNWQSTVSDSWEVDGGIMDLLDSTSACSGGYTQASDGNWFVFSQSAFQNSGYMAFSFKLSQTLTQGAQYILRFDKEFCLNSTDIEVGLSNDSTSMGTALHTFPGPTTNTWMTDIYTFQAPVAAKFLTVNVGATGSGATSVVGLDNFILTAIGNGINELSTKSISVFPNPVVDKLNIDMKNISGTNQIQLNDYTGRTIRIYSVSEVQQTLDISDISAGVYFLHIDGKQPQTFKIIKL